MRLAKLIGMLALAGFSGLAAAQEAPYADRLTGDWGGKRGELAERGIDWDLGYKWTWMRNRGGAENGSRHMGNLDVKLMLDGEKLWGWPSTTAYFHVLGNHGGRINDLTGSAMGVDNTEVPAASAKFFHAWLQRNFMDDKVSLLAGLYPIDSEFYVTDASGLFLHPSFGMSAELAQTGKAGPSVFNTSSFGVRLRVQPDPGYYFQLALSDGVPGHPENPRGTHVRFDRGDGTLVIAEAGVRFAEFGHVFEPVQPEKGVPVPPEIKVHEHFEPISKVAIGAWRYNPKFDDLVDPTQRRRAWGAYLMAEQTLYAEAGDPSQGLAAFIRHGIASREVHALKSSTSIGFIYTGLIPGRDEDVFGMAVTRGNAGQPYIDSVGGADGHETALEIGYRYQATPWLAIQPDVQFIVNPGLDPALRNARVIGARVEVTF